MIGPFMDKDVKSDLIRANQFTGKTRALNESLKLLMVVRLANLR